jgi:hypothetical protein
MTIYLYIKQHKITGLKYFGKTSKKDPYTYLGSGKYWRRHLKVHGCEIETTNVWTFENGDDCEKFALEFSNVNNIVESKEWANLRPENGKDGAPVGSPGMKGEKNPRFGKTKDQNSFYKKKHSQETIELYKKQKEKGNNPRAKKITTPQGKFTNVKEAGKILKMHLSTLRKYLNEGKEGYKWGWD